ncbi:MAG TPA: hypothetical protein VGG99_18900 [Acetobacteraceae bacterium]|jgi:hypothetical protein
MENDLTRLSPADLDDVVEALAFALRYEGRRRVHNADSIAARVAAERLARHLKQSGFVIMKRPPAPWHSAPAPYGHAP